MRILVAEDDPVSRRLLEATLNKWGYQVIACSDGISAIQALQRPDAPSLALLDWMMPGMDGVQVCRELRQGICEPYTYVLLLTAKNQRSDIITGLEAGADDYIIKPFDANELRMRLRAGRRILDLQAELIFAREELRDQATRDSLTRLWNRAAIFDILQSELGRARRGDASVSVILADLDHFKRINDTYGHLVGDAVLRETASRMRSAVRPYDEIGRYGGEEFLLVLPNCGTDAAVALGERLQKAISEEAIILDEGAIPITLSLGVATSEATIDMHEFLAAADAALYRAKDNGRNRLELAYQTDSNNRELFDID